MHITRLQGKPEAEVNEGKNQPGGRLEPEEEEEPETVWERVVVKDKAGDGITEGE